mmetsp:Transcript_39831/g.105583  ORF Transcript_39831/g.105583 Transcript_39831/m.105583 type:complete len:293 (-) Transcript_39831:928-1806(-)
MCSCHEKRLDLTLRGLAPGVHTGKWRKTSSYTFFSKTVAQLFKTRCLLLQRTLQHIDPVCCGCEAHVARLLAVHLNLTSLLFSDSGLPLTRLLAVLSEPCEHEGLRVQLRLKTMKALLVGLHRCRNEVLQLLMQGIHIRPQGRHGLSHAQGLAEARCKVLNLRVQLFHRHGQSFDDALLNLGVGPCLEDRIRLECTLSCCKIIDRSAYLAHLRHQRLELYGMCLACVLQRFGDNLWHETVPQLNDGSCEQFQLVAILVTSLRELVKACLLVKARFLWFLTSQAMLDASECCS